jgi:tetratricopeptide (TPR) repeat protein
MVERPVVVKLGYLPNPQLLKISVADHGLLVAQMAVVKVLFYFGTVTEKFFVNNIIIPPETANMYRTLVTANQLDPYNMDVYYFAQAAFTWEHKRIAEVNELLERGMKYRTWDSWLPFYLAFNYSYFLKDYQKSSKYMQKAAEMTKNPLFAQLAARYYYESNQTGFALAFLDSMIAQAKDKRVKLILQVRRNALQSVVDMERTLAEFRSKTGRQAHVLEELVHAGLLERIPDDPYGGKFFIDEQGRVRSTSKFANPKYLLK